MAKIYLVRHGESIANTKGVYQGQTYDTPLSGMGEKQTEKLAEYFNDKNVTKILASPLIRTKETAKKVAIVKHLGVVETPELIETNHGQWEGLEKKVIMQKWPNLYQLWLTNPADVRFPRGEAFSQTRKRVILWWKNVVKEKGDFLIVTHDNIIRIIVAEVLGLDLNNIWKFQLNPAAVTTIEIDRGICKLLTLDDKKHLENLMVNLANHAL